MNKEERCSRGIIGAILFLYNGHKYGVIWGEFQYCWRW